ncbi:MAG TPA: trimethylamine methyltransferase family protein [Candidatus Hydrogenedentes bacterium]|nr:trimethylamine methyltransferase family protein [Candidatus Hydrogenedentota bacterium]
MESDDAAGRFAGLVERIVEGAVTVLDRKGLAVADAGLRKRLAGTPGIAVKGERAHFAPERTGDFLESYCAGREYRPASGFSVGATAHAHHIVDLDGASRPITLGDIEEGARLADALRGHGIVGGAPGIPQDVPPPLQGIAQFVASAKGSRACPAYALRALPEAEEYIAECCRILGVPYAIGVHVVSPLRLEGQEVDCALHMLRRLPDAPVGIGTMPILGMTAPATIPGGFVLALAEVLGAGMVFQATGAANLSLCVNVYPIDMRTATFVYGTPSNIAINLLEIEVNKRLKTEIQSKSFKTMSQQPDQQAAAQKAFFTGYMASRGKRSFTGAGSLSLDELYSPVQLVIDCELLGVAKRTAEMAESCLGQADLLVDAVLENAGGSFMTEPTTLARFRDLQWDSALFSSRMFQQWLAAGSPRCFEAARERARELARDHVWALDPGKSAALDAVYRHALQKLG